MEFIPLSKPNITDKDLQQVESVIRSGMLVQGKYVTELEKTFEQYNNLIHASALSNGTVTLHLALKILGIKQGDEVIVLLSHMLQLLMLLSMLEQLRYLSILT